MQTTRAAWLVLGSLSVPLDDVDGGWICQELDLGYPDIRDVTNPNPVAHGLVDRTKFFGGRAVTAKIMAYPGRMTLDQAVEQFAPFMDVGARPELHYTTDGDETERVLVLRASAWSAPMDPPPERPFQLSWIAPDPVASSVASSSATAWSGSGGIGGRTYNLTFNRVYPGGGGGLPGSGTLISAGDVGFQPYLRIFGPITGPVVTFVTAQAPAATYRVAFLSTTRIDAGHFIGVDTAGHGAWLDDNPALPQLSQLDWTRMAWPVLPVAPNSTTMSLTGQNTTGISQVQATWQDRFLV